MDLNVLLEPKIDLERLTQVLDQLGHEGRTHTIRTWGRPHMERLWEATKGYRPVTLDDFVPPSVGPLVEVIHELKNSLPLFSVSQKRFCRPDDAEAKELWGYNHAPTSGFTGPGYFVVRPASVPGEVIFDYFTQPKGRVESWPAIVPNEARLGRFVYARMYDHMHAISSHVTIGRARKPRTGDAPPDPNKTDGDDAGWMDAWFVLCRKDPN